MTRKQYNRLRGMLDGANAYVVVHEDKVAPKYMLLEVRKEDRLYYCAMVSINSGYKDMEAVVRRVLSLSEELTSIDPT